ncbi:MAG: glycosyltransferase [Chrysiogenales bacterium]|nr:glycosyltransferase [Candidatus Aminicenantes bacterium]TFG79023.1 MAG: glycosyltransferase [Chrysiogenales bacterium]
MKKFLRRLARVLPDKLYVQFLYLKTHGRLLRLHRPRTFNEKVQWYKLYYRDPLMTTLSDKYEVRKYLQAKDYGRLLNELYGVYESADEIDLATLPASFVLKATHGSSMNIICRDKKNLDWDKCRRLLTQWLATNHFYSGRQWSYKNIRPRLICEKYLQNEEFAELIDYKFYCYHGKPEMLLVCTGRHAAGGVKYNAYDMDWNRIYTFKGKPCSELAIEKPENFAAMVAIAKELCENFPFIRVDLYSIKGKVIFGEFTFYPDSGMVPFTPDQYNYFLGDFFVLPGKTIC